MEPLDEATIRGSFINCSKGEAKRLSLPAAEVDWGNLDFLGWHDPKAPANCYLVLPGDQGPVGIAAKFATRARTLMKQSFCSLCMAVHDMGDVGLLSARRIGQAGKLGNTVGIYTCVDLACSLRARGLRGAKAWTGVTEEEVILRLTTKITSFVAEVQIDNS
ncbi:FBP domain-containing protein [Pseudonocardiaceae bacterium YIM PH 21723]|nr:FBP domain-containing protein [Pseudonocardiaceae bacterium YIM PH 21723]